MSEEVEEEETVTIDYLQIVESQLSILSSVTEYPDDMYDEMQQSKIKTASLAFKIINKIQRNIFDSL